MQDLKVTLTSALDCTEITTDGSFDFDHVLDLRAEKGGNPRPIEEIALKRLRNHFISYEQIPVVSGKTGPCQEVHFCETLKDVGGKTLVVTEDIANAAALLGIYGISFESRVLYVVETGKGDFVKTLPPQNHPKEKIAAFAG